MTEGRKDAISGGEPKINRNREKREIKIRGGGPNPKGVRARPHQSNGGGGDPIREAMVIIRGACAHDQTLW